MPLLLLVSWFVVCTTSINHSVNDQNLDFGDILSPNSERPWWRNTNSSHLMIVTLLFEFIFLLLAIVARLSQYASSHQLKQESYLETKTKTKRLLDWSFGFLSTALMGFYVTYVNGVVIWFILGAVLNPNRFLQYASAGTTLYLFVASKVYQLNQTQDTLHSNLLDFVEDEVKLTLQRNMDELIEIPVL